MVRVGRSNRNGTLARVLAFVERHGEASYRSMTVAKLSGSPGALAVTLTRLVQAGRLQRIGRGVYAPMVK